MMNPAESKDGTKLCLSLVFLCTLGLAGLRALSGQPGVLLGRPGTRSWPGCITAPGDWCACSRWTGPGTGYFMALCYRLFGPDPDYWQAAIITYRLAGALGLFWSLAIVWPRRRLENNRRRRRLSDLPRLFPAAGLPGLCLSFRVPGLCHAVGGPFAKGPGRKIPAGPASPHRLGHVSGLLVHVHGGAFLRPGGAAGPFSRLRLSGRDLGRGPEQIQGPCRGPGSLSAGHGGVFVLAAYDLYAAKRQGQPPGHH